MSILVEPDGFPGDLEVDDWFRESGRVEPWWYVVGVEEQGDDVHIFYTSGPDDNGEISEAIYDSSAVIQIKRGSQED